VHRGAQRAPTEPSLTPATRSTEEPREHSASLRLIPSLRVAALITVRTGAVDLADPSWQRMRRADARIWKVAGRSSFALRFLAVCALLPRAVETIVLERVC
jgi:hypothetical protein